MQTVGSSDIIIVIASPNHYVISEIILYKNPKSTLDYIGICKCYAMGAQASETTVHQPRIVAPHEFSSALGVN